MTDISSMSLEELNQEIHDVMAEMRARDGGYYRKPYKVNYTENYADLLCEREEYLHRYNGLKEAYDECLKRCTELERELERELNRDRDEDDLPEDDDELDN